MFCYCAADANGRKEAVRSRQATLHQGSSAADSDIAAVATDDEQALFNKRSPLRRRYRRLSGSRPSLALLLSVWPVRSNGRHRDGATTAEWGEYKHSLRR